MSLNFKFLLERGMTFFYEEIQLAIITIKDKGWRRFSRAFVAGGAFILATYMLIYKPAETRLKMIGQKIADVKAEFDSAQSYESLNDSLYAIYSQVPPMSQKGDWLNAAILNCLRQENVTADSIEPKEQVKKAQLVVDESLTVTADATYRQLVLVINRLEQLKPKVRIVSLELKKNAAPVGVNHVSLEVETLIPMQKFAP